MLPGTSSAATRNASSVWLRPSIVSSSPLADMSATGIGWDSILLGLALYAGGAQDGVSPEEAAAWMP